MWPSDPGPSPTGRRERQRAFWREKYLEDPAFFGDRESEFARWCLPILRAEPGITHVVELGCGYGRDTQFFGENGFRVQGVDLALRRPASPPDPRGPSIEFLESDCLVFLEGRSPESVDAVYSNMLFNMDFTEAEHRRLMEAIYRSLRPRGLHLFSARSTSDPWYGRGRPMGPDTFDPAPLGITMHFFSPEYVARLSQGLFTPFHLIERSEGEDDFPMRLVYVAQRRAR